jgi:hypothetical protein
MDSGDVVTPAVWHYIYLCGIGIILLALAVIIPDLAVHWADRRDRRRGVRAYQDHVLHLHAGLIEASHQPTLEFKARQYTEEEVTPPHGMPAQHGGFFHGGHHRRQPHPETTFQHGQHRLTRPMQEVRQFRPQQPPQPYTPPEPAGLHHRKQAELPVSDRYMQAGKAALHTLAVACYAPGIDDTEAKAYALKALRSPPT